MSNSNAGDAAKSKGPWHLPIMVLCGIGGYLLGKYVLAQALPDSIALERSEAIALVVAAIYLVIGLVTLLASMSQRMGLAWRVFDDEEAWQDERALTLVSAMACLLLAAIPVVLVMAGSLEQLGKGAALGIIAPLALASAFLTWRCWQMMDELWRMVTNEATVVAFWLVFCFGSAWSIAAQLQFAMPLAPLDWISLFLVASLVASVLATVKRGMHEG